MKNKMTYREALKEWNSEIMGPKIYGIPRKGYTPYFQVQDLKKDGKIEHYDPKPIRFMETQKTPEKPTETKPAGFIASSEMPKEIAKPVATLRKRPTIAIEPEPEAKQFSPIPGTIATTYEGVMKKITALKKLFSELPEDKWKTLNLTKRKLVYGQINNVDDNIRSIRKSQPDSTIKFPSLNIPSHIYRGLKKIHR